MSVYHCVYFQSAWSCMTVCHGSGCHTVLVCWCSALSLEAHNAIPSCWVYVITKILCVLLAGNVNAPACAKQTNCHEFRHRSADVGWVHYDSSGLVVPCQTRDHHQPDLMLSTSVQRSSWMHCPGTSQVLLGLWSCLTEDWPGYFT